jgi:6-phosphogluconolactonase (cycloisomerase 2 family)/enamine deaminase RidA (YjgF/YER057c/UK114 family)
MLATLLISLHILFSFQQTDSSNYQLLVGSYTREGNPGIEVFDASTTSGSVRSRYNRQMSNASFLAVSANTQFLYTVSEQSGSASVAAFRLNNKGEYDLLNTAAAKGSGPCHVALREATQTVYAANYGSGSLSVFKTENGRLLPIAQHIQYTGSSVNKSRQLGPHAHQVVVSPDQLYLYVNDLGTDRIYQHRIYADGLVNETPVMIQVKPGNGPRHMTFNKTGSHAYLLNELSGTVDVFRVQDGQFSLLQSIASDTSSAESKASADIHVSPNGKWLISSNRITTDQLTVFAINPDGTLRKSGHQPVAKMPRNFNFDPTGQTVWVGSQTENRIQVFSFDDASGKLTDLKKDIQVKMPVCLVFVKPQPETDAEASIRSNNITLIPPTAPIANYVKYVQVGNTVYLSGHGPDKPGGGQLFGKLGKDLTIEEGQAAARLTGISLISTLRGYIGDLNRVKRIVKVVGLVNCTPDFAQQPQVMNGCSNLLVEVFGDRGRHARTSVGVNALPNNIAVEIEMIVELK